jgi:hypothetical protein
MAVGPRKSYSRLGAKVCCGVTMELRWPRFMSRKKLNPASDGHSSCEELLTSYTESGPDGLPEALASFNRTNSMPANSLSVFVPESPATDLVKNDPVRHQWNLWWEESLIQAVKL